MILLIMKGGGTSRTKHWRARMFISKELVELREIILLYLNMKPADGATKSLEGKPQKDYTDFVLGLVRFTS